MLLFHKPSSLPSFAITFSWIPLELLSSFKYLSVTPILSPYIFFICLCVQKLLGIIFRQILHTRLPTPALFALFLMNTLLLYEIFTPNLSFNPLPGSVQPFALKSASSLNFVSPIFQTYPPIYYSHLPLINPMLSYLLSSNLFYHQSHYSCVHP